MSKKNKCFFCINNLLMFSVTGGWVPLRGAVHLSSRPLPPPNPFSHCDQQPDSQSGSSLLTTNRHYSPPPRSQQRLMPSPAPG